MNLLSDLLGAAESRRPLAAIIDGSGRTATFGDLLDGSASLAGEFRDRGIGAGDRVLLTMPLGIALYAGLLALWRLGAVAVLPEPAMGLSGVRSAARTADPVGFLLGGWYRLLPLLVPRLARATLLPSTVDPARCDDPVQGCVDLADVDRPGRCAAFRRSVRVAGGAFSEVGR